MSRKKASSESRLLRLGHQVAGMLLREGLTYSQSKAVFHTARVGAGLTVPPRAGAAIARLTLEEELRFMDTAYERAGRVGLMMQTLLETGTRVSEFVLLRIEDLSLLERRIVIKHGKGGKRREVPLRRDLLQLLSLHIGSRQTGPLFASRQKPYVYTRQRIGQIVRQVAEQAGITKRVYPHLLRHTVATRLLNLGMGINEVQRFLGHEDLRSTQLYAQTSIALLQARFEAITEPIGRRLVTYLQGTRGEEVAAFAALLLAEHPRETVKTVF